MCKFKLILLTMVFTLTCARMHSLVDGAILFSVLFAGALVLLGPQSLLLRDE